MHEAQPSRTALRVALRRAAHQIHDAPPLVFDDPLALRILGPEHREEVNRTPDSLKRPFSAALRAFMVARARLAEDTLAHGIAANNTRQYLVLGAGLDTFAYRNPFAEVRVFEVDHPATQAWKRECLAAAGIAIPETMQFVPVDFERQAVDSGVQPLVEELSVAGFDRTLPTVTAWLGVVPYLTLEAFRGTTSLLGSFAAGSSVIFDYSQPREVLPPVEQKMLDSMAERVALAGEPFQRFFTPETLVAELALAGLSVVEDLGSAALTARFFSGRTDGLLLRGQGGRMCVAKSG